MGFSNGFSTRKLFLRIGKSRFSRNWNHEIEINEFQKTYEHQAQESRTYVYYIQELWTFHRPWFSKTQQNDGRIECCIKKGQFLQKIMSTSPWIQDSDYSPPCTSAHVIIRAANIAHGIICAQLFMEWKGELWKYMKLLRFSIETCSILDRI